MSLSSSSSAASPIPAVVLPGEGQMSRWAWLRPWAAMLGFFLALSTLLRVVLYLKFGQGLELAALPELLILGALNDALIAPAVLAPLTLFVLLAPSPRRSWTRGLLLSGLWAMLFGLLFVSTAEYFFFEEFDARFNLVAVDYLIYPTEVIGGITDEYPVLPLLLLFAVLATALLWPLRRWLTAGGVVPTHRQRAPLAALYLALLIVPAYAWNAEQLSVFAQRNANEIAGNGIARFIEAFRTNHIDYREFYRTGESAVLQQRLAADLMPGGGRFTDLPGGSLSRRHEGRSDGLGRLNVVVIVEESLGANSVGAYGGTPGLTPRFDALAQQGLLFTRAFATGTRTVRGLEAISASLPPIPSESIIKRPGNEDIATWGRVMNDLGYRSSFLYGGYGVFDNMNHYFGANGFVLSDRGDIAHPRFTNAWGVADEDLFAHALDYFDRESAHDQPFFAIIMSTSNHKPFTFPDGVPGVPARGGGRRAGVRYADHALGGFIAAAERHAWFDNTLFVIVADHAARLYGRADIPLNSYEIPLLFYAPKHLAPGTVATPTSQIDIAPTVLGLLGLPYKAPFFGADILNWPADRPRTLLFNHNHDVAALRGDRLCVLGLRKTAHCSDYRRLPGPPSEATTRLTPSADDPELIELATAYYQTAYAQFVEHRYH